MKTMTTLLILLPALAFAQSLQNPDFTGGLTGWTVIESGGTDAPGAVVVDAGEAVLSEGDSFLVALEQTVDKPAGLLTLTVPISATPGLDEAGTGLPDTFEVAVLSADGHSLVPAWRPFAATFYNLPEAGAARLGGGASLEEGVLSVDVSGIPDGTAMTLRFQLIGGDDDTGSVVRVGPVGLVVANVPPIAVASAPGHAECSAGTITLDSAGSMDPDDDPLSFEWRDPDGAVLGTGATQAVTPPLGSSIYTLIVRDDHEHEATATVTVVVGDTTPPVVAGVPEGPIEVVANGACAGVVPALDEGATVEDACGEATVVQDPPAGTALQLGVPVTVTITAADGAGNETEVQRVVTLLDEELPQLSPPPAPGGLDAGAECTAALPDLVAEAAAGDNCGAPLVTQESLAGAPLAPGEHLVVLTAVDGSGNEVTGEVTVIVSDVEPPSVVSAPSAPTVSAGADCGAPAVDLAAQVVAEDACGIASVQQSPAAGSALVLGKTTVTVVVTDEAGNETHLERAVTVVDDTPPAPSGPVDPVKVPGGANCAATIPNLRPLIGAEDACGPVTVVQSPEAGTTLSPGEPTDVVVTMTDLAGNAGEVTVTVTLDDSAGPLIGALPEEVVVSADGSCAGGVPDVAALVEIDDTCGGDPVISQDPPVGQALELGEPVTVTLSATDAQGNETTATTTVVLADETGPVVDEELPPQVVPAGQGCHGTVPNLVAQVQASDACGDVTVTQSPAAGAALDLGELTPVTLTFIDAAGNTTEDVATVVLKDETKPQLTLPEAIEVSADAACLGAVPQLSTEAATSDACGNVTLTQSVAAGTALALGVPTVVTVTAKDGAGNQVTAQTELTLVDDTPPVGGGSPEAVVVPTDSVCAGAVPDLTGEWSPSDVCGPVTVTQSPEAGEALLGSAPTEVTLTAADEAGNEVTTTVEVTLADTTPPVLEGPAEPVVLSAGASCAGEIPDLTALVTTEDACGAPTLSQAPAAGEALSLGATDVTVTATDGAGNAAELVVPVTLADDEAPALTPVEPVELEIDDSCSGLVPDLRPAAAAADNCAEPTVTQDPPADTALTPLDIGQPQTVTLIATDAAGNTAETTTTVLLIDPEGACGDTPGPGTDVSMAEGDQVAEPKPDPGPEPAPDAGPASPDAGPIGADVTGSPDDPEPSPPTSGTDDGGCGCRTAGAPGPTIPWGPSTLVLLALLAARRLKTPARPGWSGPTGAVPGEPRGVPHRRSG